MPARPSLKRRLETLAALQSESGCFPSLSSTSASFSRAVPEAAVFPTSLVLFSLSEALSVAPSKIASAAAKRAAAYLESQKSPAGTWNYLERGAATSRGTSLPEDLDDGSCALIALAKASGKAPDGQAMAAFVRQLIACEEKEGGPYHTWVVPAKDRPKWRDLDVAVNANVGSALALGGVTLPAVEAFIDAAVKGKRLESLYYKSPLAVAYFIARYYEGKGKGERLAAIVAGLRRPDGGWGSSLETALAVCAMLRLGSSARSVESAIRRLEEAADGRGLWKAAPLYVEEIKAKRSYFAGSDALTSAIAVEALALFKKAEGRAPKSATQAEEYGDSERICRAAIARARELVSGFGHPVSSQCEAALQRIEKGGLRRLVSLLPHQFSSSLKTSGADDECLVTLGAANLIGWMGYTLQDDIVDGDADGRLLPASNVLVRLSLSLLEGAAPTVEGKEYVRKTFDLIDRANAWEASSAALPRSGDGFSLPSSAPDYRGLAVLADKSFGHALGPLIVLMRSGSPVGSKRFSAAERFFREYIIARQLNDDAHDWIEDYKGGRLNAASAPLVERYLGTPAGRERKRASALSSLPDLQRLFWERDVRRIARAVLHRAAAARKALASSGLMKDASFAEVLLSPIERAAKKAVAERAKAMEFIKAYS